MRRSHALVTTLVSLVAAACASAPPPPEPVPAPVVASGTITDGCPGIVAEFLAKPDSTPVTKVPEPIKMDPRPFRPPYPQDLLAKGKAEFKATVLVDTLGKADMKTFKILVSTHKWFNNQAVNAIAKWKFRPAEINGCKVPRNYLFSATMGS
ncbi:MAG: hypothetical protein HY275_19080 [Gemmatimonadetes bacterium]|nr:hypothetical protein [Gemmatimonadota bacterium]